FADEDPALSRGGPSARGRVARIRKRTCHITIELAQGAPTSTASAVPAMAAPEPEPVEEPEAVAAPETVDAGGGEAPEAAAGAAAGRGARDGRRGGSRRDRGSGRGAGGFGGDRGARGRGG